MGCDSWKDDAEYMAKLQRMYEGIEKLSRRGEPTLPAKELPEATEADTYIRR